MEQIVGAEAWERYWTEPDPDRRDRKWALYTKLAVMVAEITDGNQTTVAEVGCGVGAFLDRLRGIKGVNRIGFDISPTAVQACKTRMHNVHEADAHELPVDGGFDVIVAIDLLAHLESPLGALEHWRELLRDGGKLIVVDPHKSQPDLFNDVISVGYSKVPKSDFVKVGNQIFTIVIADK